MNGTDNKVTLGKDDWDEILDRPKEEKPKRSRKKLIIAAIVILLVIGLAFWVIQSGMKWTANSAYKAGAACCKDIWRQAEEIANAEGLPLEGEISPESPIGQRIEITVGEEYGSGEIDFRVCCQNGRIYMVVCNMYGRKLSLSDIRFHTKDEQINSLSSIFTRGKTVACITETELTTEQND